GSHQGRVKDQEQPRYDKKNPGNLEHVCPPLFMPGSPGCRCRVLHLAQVHPPAFLDDSDRHGGLGGSGATCLPVVNIGRLWVVNIERSWVVNVGRLGLVKSSPISDRHTLGTHGTEQRMSILEVSI